MAQNKSDRANKDVRFYRAAYRWIGIGIEFCLVIGAFVFVGYLLDQREGTTPGWMILGFLVGFGIELYTMIKRAQSTERELDDSDQSEPRT